MGCSAHCPANAGLWIFHHPVRLRIPSRTDAATVLPGVSWLFFRRALVPITPTSPMRALDRFFRTGADFTISGSLIADILFNEAESDSSCEFQARVFAVKGMPSLFAGVSSNRSVSRVWSPSHASAQLHVYRSIHMFSSFHLNRSTTTCRCNQNQQNGQNGET